MTMRYKIEFLEDSTNEYSECMTMPCDGTLEIASALARSQSAHAKSKYHADGYQIRDMDDARIVFLEHFNI
jgi:hypothetical protein